MKMLFSLLSIVLVVDCVAALNGYATSDAYSAPLPNLQANQLMSSGGDNYQQPQALTAAVRGSNRNVKVIDVPSSIALPAETMTINVPPSSQPLTFILRSRSSDLNLQSTHEADPGSYQETSSEDKPHVLVHTVTRPVLQEIREIIAPYRRVTQEVKPVQESSETLVARAKDEYKPQPQRPQPKRIPAKPKQLAKPKPAPAPLAVPQQQQYPAPRPIQQIKQKAAPY